MINLIIFSKNRSLQLDGLLTSIQQNCDIFDKVNILHKATEWDYEKGYNILIEENKDKSRYNFIKETNFKKDTESLFNDFSHTCFLVDDCILYREIKHFEKLWLSKIDKEIIFSLRLGLYQRTTNASDSICRFDWSKDKGDFNYPLSVDGHIFETGYITNLIKNIDYCNANKLEIGLQTFKESAPSFMACFFGSILVSIPVNKVSDTSSCSAGSEYSYSTEYLNKLFLEGKRLDYNNMDFSDIKGCHQEIKFKFK